MNETMPDDFTPRGRGRPHVVDPQPVYDRLKREAELNTNWLAFTTYSENQVRSLKGSLTKLGCEVSVSHPSKKGGPVLYARISPKDES